MSSSDSSASAIQPVSNGKRILVLGDHSDFVRAIQKILELRGYHVETSKNDLSALTRIKENLPNLIIFNNVIPEGDGFEITKAIHSGTVTAEIPILLLGPLVRETPRHNPDPKPFLRKGANRVLFKPFGSREFVKTVNEMLLDSSAKDQ